MHKLTSKSKGKYFYFTGWYHLSCGVDRGCFQDDKTKESFCHRHASSKMRKNAGFAIQPTSPDKKWTRPKRSVWRRTKNQSVSSQAVFEEVI